MKKRIAELLKIIHATDLKTGLAAFYKKNGSTPAFYLNLPNNQGKIMVRRKTTDWTVFKQVFIWKEYNYPIKFNPKCIIDAGANVGYAALWFRYQFPDAAIISIEPETSNFEALKLNTNAFNTIRHIKAGLWSRPCYLKIINENKGNWAFRTEEVMTPSADSIQAVSLPQVMAEKGWDTIDVLKIDIEGAEKQLFSENTEGWLPKTKMIFLELHDHLDKNCSKAVFSALSQYDFSVDISGENLVLINNLYQ